MATKTSPKIAKPMAKGGKKAGVVPMQKSGKTMNNIPKGEMGAKGPKTGKKK
jgi:hypothetical protein